MSATDGESFGRFAEPNAAWFRELSLMTGSIFFKFGLADGWKLEYLSGDLGAMLGHSAPQYLDDPGLLREFLHPEDVGVMSFDDVPMDQTRQAEIRFTHGDGHTVWIQISCRKLRSDDGEIIVEGVAQDVTALRRTEHALRESEEAAQADRARLRAAMDAMLDPQFALQAVRDDAGKIVDFIYVDANDAGVRHDQRAREELIGSRLLDLVPGHKDGLLQRYAQVIDTGEPLILDGIPYADEMQGGQERLFDMRAVKVGEILNLTIRDVTERVEAAEALAASQARYRMLAQHATDMVYRADVEGTIEWVSDGVTNVLGYTPEEFVGMNALDQLVPDDRVLLDAAMTDTSPDARRSMRLRVRTRDGSIRWIDALIQPIANDMGDVTGFVGGIRDVDAEVQALQNLDQRARTDVLTGMPNRAEGVAQLDALLAGGESVSLAFCDVDNFKQINDTYGHAAGDRVLIDATARARASVRSDDVVVRFGGDEIMLVLRGVADPDTASDIAEKVRAAIAEPVVTPAGEVTPTVSIGVVTAQPGENAETVINRADQAMYRAKGAGRDRVAVDA